MNDRAKLTLYKGVKMRTNFKVHMKQAQVSFYSLIVAAAIHGGIAQAATLKLSTDFESGNYKDDYNTQLYPVGNVTTVSSPVREGNYAVRAEIGGSPPSSGSNNRYRAEILPWTNVIPYWDQDEWWVGFSINMEDWPIGDAAWTLIQLHGSDWKSSDSCIKNNGNAFTLQPADGTHLAARVILNGGTGGSGGAFRNTSEVWRKPLVKNVWEDFVLNFKLSDSGKGFWRIWHNGNLVYEKYNITNVTTADGCGVSPPPERRFNYWKFGLYAGSSPQSVRSVAFDSIKWAKGTGDEGYQMVAPGGGTPPPNPPSNIQ